MSKSKIGAHTGVVLSVSAMYMYYLRCENLPNENKKKNKVIYLLSFEQLILYLAQLNPWLFWYEIILNTDKA